LILSEIAIAKLRLWLWRVSLRKNGCQYGGEPEELDIPLYGFLALVIFPEVERYLNQRKF
jgi:hypothetical protein